MALRPASGMLQLTTRQWRVASAAPYGARTSSGPGRNTRDSQSPCGWTRQLTLTAVVCYKCGPLWGENKHWARSQHPGQSVPFRVDASADAHGSGVLQVRPLMRREQAVGQVATPGSVSQSPYGSARQMTAAVTAFIMKHQSARVPGTQAEET
jgi:hypothetical protein